MSFEDDELALAALGVFLFQSLYPAEDPGCDQQSASREVGDRQQVVCQWFAGLIDISRAALLDDRDQILRGRLKCCGDHPGTHEDQGRGCPQARQHRIFLAHQVQWRSQAGA